MIKIYAMKYLKIYLKEKQHSLKHLKKCYPDKKFPEEKESKFEKLTREEIEKLKSLGKDVGYLTGKKKQQLILI